MSPSVPSGKTLPRVLEVEADHTGNWPETTIVIEHPDRHSKKWWGYACAAALLHAVVQTLIKPIPIDRFLSQLPFHFALFFFVMWYSVYRPRIQLDPTGITLGQLGNPKHIPWRVIQKYRLITPWPRNPDRTPATEKYIAFYNAQETELGRIQEMLGTKEQRESMLAYIKHVLGEPSPK